jgi:nudix-type nucleoside diphosphatase (YffH/AdpP family)
MLDSSMDCEAMGVNTVRLAERSTAGCSTRLRAAEGFMKPEILERRVVRAGYVTVEHLLVQLADGVEVWRDVERHGDGAAVLPYDGDRRTALVLRLFRVPAFDVAGETLLEEACAEMIEHETPETAVRREALEELGVRLGALEWVARVWSSPGVGAERVSLFLAPYNHADRIAPGGGVEDEHESITAVERPLADLAADADVGAIVDVKLLTLVLALRLRQPELFVESAGPGQA